MLRITRHNVIPAGVMGIQVRMPTSVAPTLIIHDEFTDTDGTLPTAHTIAPVNTPNASWANVPYWGGDYATIQSNALLHGSSGSEALRLNSGVADCIISAVFYVMDAWRHAGILFRLGGVVDDNNNYWRANIYVSGNTFSLIEYTYGASYTRASTSVTISAYVNYTIQVTLSGTSIKATLNGGNEITYTSSVRQDKTYHGIYTGGPRVRIDEFKIWR